MERKLDIIIYKRSAKFTIIERSNIFPSFSLGEKFLTRESRDFDRSRGVKGRKERKEK